MKYNHSQYVHRLDLRVRTSNALRAIDDWKRRLSTRNHRFLGGISLLLFAIAFAGRRGAFVLVLLVLTLGAEFAAAQFASLVLLGFFMLELRFLRMSNHILTVTRS